MGRKDKKKAGDDDDDDMYDIEKALAEVDNDEADKPAKGGKKKQGGKQKEQKEGDAGEKAPEDADDDDKPAKGGKKKPANNKAKEDAGHSDAPVADKGAKKGDAGKAPAKSEGKAPSVKDAPAAAKEAAPAAKEAAPAAKPAAPAPKEAAPAAKDAAPAAAPAAGEEEEDSGEEDEGAGGDKKKKKKKKKAGEKKDEKKPSAAVRKMQEALQALKLEEERQRQEALERQRALEEEERRREEEARLEEERKRRKKEKEKEKKERLRKEGKLLSKSDKEKLARAQAALEAMRAQGIQVPTGTHEEGEEAAPKKQKVVYTKKKKAPQPGAKVAAEGDAKTTAEGADGAAPAAAHEDDVDETWEKTSESGGEESEGEGAADGADGGADAESARRTHAPTHAPPASRPKDRLRSPICCVLGHVDTGKTKLLDKIRQTNVQGGEAGGITQQIGASYFPIETIAEQTSKLKDKFDSDIMVPGLLIIDTPGHESFSNLRTRGSSLCDIAILVVDIMHGLEPQTIESINLLKRHKTPFIVALNKIDRIYDWKATPWMPVQESLAQQKKNVLMEFGERSKAAITAFAEQGLNACLYYENKDFRKYVSLVPTSAHTGEGIPDLLMLLVQLTQKMMAERLAFVDDVQCTVLEVKVVSGLGTTIDVIISQGCLREGNTIVLCGTDGPVVTQIKALLMPQPLRELRVKNQYQQHKEVYAAQGVKILAKHLDTVVAGTQIFVAKNEDEIPALKEEAQKELEGALQSIKTVDRGVAVQASTLGSLEALMDFLNTSKIPVSIVNIGPVHKRDIIKASVQLEHDRKYAVMMAFDVKIDKDAREMADELGIRIFSADIIYHLFDSFTAYIEELKRIQKEEHRSQAVFPCRLKILPQFIFNKRDPIVIGVQVVDGVLRNGTPICVPSKDRVEIGTVGGIERDHKAVEEARKGAEVCVKILHTGADAPKLMGRHFDENDELASKITRESINVLKDYFRDEMTKEDWVLVMQLKKVLDII